MKNVGKVNGKIVLGSDTPTDLVYTLEFLVITKYIAFLKASILSLMYSLVKSSIEFTVKISSES